MDSVMELRQRSKCIAVENVWYVCVLGVGEKC